MTATVRELIRTECPTYLSPFEEAERLSEAWVRPLSMFNIMWPMEVSEFETVFPRVDMYEKGDELIMKADLPGMRKEDVDISLSENVLTVSGESKTEEKVEKGDYFTCERKVGSFCRRFELPADVDSEKVTARLENGVLEIRLPKTHKLESSSRKIEINS